MEYSVDGILVSWDFKIADILEQVCYMIGCSYAEHRQEFISDYGIHSLDTIRQLYEVEISLLLAETESCYMFNYMAVSDFMYLLN